MECLLIMAAILEFVGSVNTAIIHYYFEEYIQWAKYHYMYRILYTVAQHILHRDRLSLHRVLYGIYSLHNYICKTMFGTTHGKERGGK